MAYLGNDLQVAFPVYRNIDDISGSFNSVLKTFPLTVSGVAPVPAPLYSQQCLISVGGVVQRPDDSGTEGFRLSGSNIIFASAPATGADFFGVILAGADYINAGANFPSGSAAVPSITFDSDLDTGIYNSGANQVSITTSGTERLRIDSAGQIESVSLGTAAAPAFSFTTDANTGIYSPGADQVAISTNGTGRLFVDASGDSLFQGQVFGRRVAGAGRVFVDRVEGSYASPTAVGAANVGALIGRGYDGTQFRDTGNLTFVSDGTITSSSSPGSVVLATTPSSSTSPIERLRITSAGLVGVGTSSPGSQLDIVAQDNIRGTGFQPFWTLRDSNDSNKGIRLQAAGGAGLFYTDSVGNGTWVERVRITAGGNVGIGTTSPVAKLDVNGSTLLNGDVSIGPSGSEGGQINLRNPNNTTDPLVIDVATNTIGRVFTTVNNAELLLGQLSGTGGAVEFFTGATERARIDSSGRLLVGTSTSTTGVAFASQIQSNAFYAYSASLFSADNIGSNTWFLKSRNATVNQHTAVQSGDVLGRINFAGSDGDEFIHAALIQAVVDNGAVGTAVSNNECPAALVFSTTADGASSPTERMRIAQNGVITIQNGAVAVIGTLTDGATITPDFAADCNFTVTLGGNRTIANPTNITAGQSGSIFIVQDGTGSRTLSWGSFWDFPGGTAPTLSTAANAVDRIDYIVRSSTSIHTVFTANYS